MIMVNNLSVVQSNQLLNNLKILEIIYKRNKKLLTRCLTIPAINSYVPLLEKYAIRFCKNMSEKLEEKTEINGPLSEIFIQIVGGK